MTHGGFKVSDMMPSVLCQKGLSDGEVKWSTAALRDTDPDGAALFYFY